MSISGELPAGFSDNNMKGFSFEELNRELSVGSALFRSAYVFARQLSFTNSVQKVWVGVEHGEFFGVYLYELLSGSGNASLFQWIVTGSVWREHIDENTEFEKLFVPQYYRGLPCANIFTGYPEFSDPISAASSARALESYCGVIEAWIAEVRKQGDSNKVFPVRVPEAVPRTAYADQIEPQIAHIREAVLPTLFNR